MSPRRAWAERRLRALEARPGVWGDLSGIELQCLMCLELLLIEDNPTGWGDIHVQVNLAVRKAQRYHFGAGSALSVADYIEDIVGETWGLDRRYSELFKVLHRARSYLLNPVEELALIAEGD